MKLNELFDKVHQLPTIPKIVQELIASFSDENIDLSKVGNKIAMDQVITAKVLRLANSARFGLPRKVTTVNDAVVLLGFNSLRTLVLASGITGAFPETGGLKKKDFWKGSFTVATIAKAIARQVDRPVNPETAFTCGMLHNIGELLMHVTMPEDMQKIEKATELGGNRRETQHSVLGFDYAVVGSSLAATWKFPEEILDAIGRQCDPLAGEEPSLLAAILSLAIFIERQFTSEEGYEEDVPVDVVEFLGADIEALLEQESELMALAGSFDELLS